MSSILSKAIKCFKRQKSANDIMMQKCAYTYSSILTSLLSFSSVNTSLTLDDSAVMCHLHLRSLGYCRGQGGTWNVPESPTNHCSSQLGTGRRNTYTFIADLCVYTSIYILYYI